MQIGLIVLTISVNGQGIYKTPSGKKYHLYSCRMVENVSYKLAGGSDIIRFKLTPCKICKPPIIKSLKRDNSNRNKAVGDSITHQCWGITQKGSRCKHKTRIANRYCFQHTNQNSP
jgi:hypothetical protein